MFAVIRIKGTIGVRKEIERTLRLLRLNAPNNCVVLPETESYKGMLEKVKDFTTYGKLSFDTFVAMLKKRGRLLGNRRLDEKSVRELGYKSVEELAKAVFDGKVRLKDVEKLRPVFKLTPPSKGFKSTKHHWPKGDLGDRGEDINELIKRMI